MASILSDPSAGAVLAAIEENTADFYRALLPRLPDAEIHDEIDVLHGSSSIRTPLCNAIVCARFADAEAEERLDAVLAGFRRRRVPVTWWVGPVSNPRDLGRRLERRGFRQAADMAGMALELDGDGDGAGGGVPEPAEWAPDGLTVARVREDRALDGWARAFTEGFHVTPGAAGAVRSAFAAIGYAEDAPCRQYVARLRGEPVASATLVLGAGVAGLYNIATDPRVRRRGVGAAVTLAALAEAADLGYRIGILHATAMGLGLYRALGFTERCRVQTYVRG